MRLNKLIFFVSAGTLVGIILLTFLAFCKSTSHISYNILVCFVVVFKQFRQPPWEKKGPVEQKEREDRRGITIKRSLPQNHIEHYWAFFKFAGIFLNFSIQQLILGIFIHFRILMFCTFTCLGCMWPPHYYSQANGEHFAVLIHFCVAFSLNKIKMQF